MIDKEKLRIGNFVYCQYEKDYVIYCKEIVGINESSVWVKTINEDSKTIPSMVPYDHISPIEITESFLKDNFSIIERLPEGCYKLGDINNATMLYIQIIDTNLFDIKVELETIDQYCSISINTISTIDELQNLLTDFKLNTKLKF